jgi:hypothetical protein
VLSIATNANGAATVTTTANTSLGAAAPAGAASATLFLTPYKDATTVATIADIPTQIFKFKCTAGTMPAKYLPGSCR